jgi:hypothetical protein
VRVTTAFNRMLGLPGAWVRDVAFGSEAVIVTVVVRAEKPVCSGCGARGLQVKEHREKRWRHLDLGACRCVIECRLRRLYCPGCGDVYEPVPWARAGAKYTREFDDLAPWLAQQMSQTQLTRLMRIGWKSVGSILERVVAEKLPAGRLDGLVWIGCEAVSSYCTSGNGFLRSMLDSVGVCDPLAACGLDFVVEGDRELASADAARPEFALVDPSVDHGVADVEALREVVDAEFVCGQLGRGWDAVLPAHPADAVFGERTAAGGQPAGLVEVRGELLVGVGRPELADDLGHGLGAGAASGGRS